VIWEESIIMAEEATPEELWQRIAEENPHARDDEIALLLIAAAKDNEVSFAGDPPRGSLKPLSGSETSSAVRTDRKPGGACFRK
jgi:hypothetical protein